MRVLRSTDGKNAFRATRSRTARRAADRGCARAIDEKLIVPTKTRLIEYHSSSGLLMSGGDLRGPSCAGGGSQPRWRHDGRELFYLNGNIVVAAEVNGAGASFQVGAVRQLFEVRRRTESYLGMGPGNVYDVTADGQRFLVNVVDEEQAALPPPITVITNWTSTLR